jgi:hypothetical protein
MSSQITDELAPAFVRRYWLEIPESGCCLQNVRLRSLASVKHRLPILEDPS